MDPDPTPNSRTARGEPVRQFSVFLQNRAGALLGIVKLINDAMVEVLGLSVQDSVEGTMARLVVSDPDTVETLFIEKGIPFATVELVILELADASQLSSALFALLQAETNVHFCYPLMSRPRGRPALAIYLEDTDFGCSVLSNSGFRLLYQNDLGR